MTTTTRSFVEEARREKLEAIRALGVEPYAYAYRRTHGAADAVAAFRDEEDVPVRVAGRIVSRRRHGKSTFLHVADGSGRVQAYCRRDQVGADAYELVKLLDLGDYVGVAGHMFRTKTGEVTVHAAEVTLLAKALRPPPIGKEDAAGEQHGVLQDPDQRYRQRYADLMAHPEVRDVFRTRALMARFIREFLDERGYLEVETPVLQPLYGGALARPFTTDYHALDTTFYLRIATELYLKRCVVGGMERVYELGKDFRNEGIDRLHNPEFTMLEFYAAYQDYADVMALTEELVRGLVAQVCGETAIERFGTRFEFGAPFPRVAFVDLVREHADLDLLAADDVTLRHRLEGHDIAEDLGSLPRGKLIDEVFKAFVEPQLVQPTLVLDYPIELSPLAKPKRGEPRLAERFELYVGAAEIANGFSELNDPDEQRARFEAQVTARAAGDREAHVVDEDYVRALEYGLPPTGGCGVGVDRLAMLLSGETNIRDVILFPTLRPDS
ncbi:MAG: lysine--tRNA ligase [Gemmatimonadales bacterium]